MGNPFESELKYLGPEMIRIRRHLHRHPELSHQEHETARFIAAQLDKWGISYKSNVAGTGIVALIDGESGTGPTMALRADMDALPIQEERETPYSSQNPGVMHACGHDAHCAMVLGAGKLLHSRRGHLAGRVKLIFQPSEETEPCGARAMIDAGALEDPHVDAILAAHVFPAIPTGQVGVRAGVSHANADEFRIGVRGRAGHAGYPHQAVDPIVAAAHVVVALQTIVSRRIRPHDSAVVHIGQVTGGTRPNVIPPLVELRGTFRTVGERVREVVAEEIPRIASSVAEGFGASAEVEILWGVPSVINDPALTELVARAAERIMGPGRVIWQPEPFMGADDFAHYQRVTRGVMFRLGTGNRDKDTEFPLHHPRFDVDEDALPLGAALLAQATIDFFQEAGDSANG